MNKNNHLEWKQLVFLIQLGIPALGLALTYTLVTTYLPFFIEKLSNASITGMLISVEGIFALTAPIFVGQWSDGISSNIGKRLPFFFAGVLLTSLTLILMPFSSNGLVIMTLELIFFFIGYFTMYESYLALYPDYVPDEQRGRSQGILGGFRSIGLLLALTGGGTLIDAWKPLPFLLFTAVLILVAVILYYTVRQRVYRSAEVHRIHWYSILDLVYENKKIQLWLIANTLWEAAVSVLRVFVVLYFTKGVGLSLNQSSAALSLVGLSAIIAAPFAGFLADKYQHKPVVMTSVFLFAVGLFPPIFTVDKFFLLGILPVAFVAVILMTLPFSMLMHYLPKSTRHGTGVALFGFCQGLGVLVGPVTAGLAIEASKNFDFLVFAETKGYSAMYVVAALFLLISIPFATRLFKLTQEE